MPTLSVSESVMTNALLSKSEKRIFSIGLLETTRTAFVRAMNSRSVSSPLGFQGFQQRTSKNNKTGIVSIRAMKIRLRGLIECCALSACDCASAGMLLKRWGWNGAAHGGSVGLGQMGVKRIFGESGGAAGGEEVGAAIPGELLKDLSERNVES
jgi:hypothetical protein